MSGKVSSPNRKIFLLGLPGSGKTTFGKELAVVLQLPFVDLDDEVEKAEGKKIKVVFAEAGEDHFRSVESAALRTWCAKPDGFVMATGGGTPCFFDNLDVINEAGVSIFLDVPIDEIVERVQHTALSDRPLLGAVPQDELRQHLERLYSQRIKTYRDATLTFAGEALTIESVASLLGN